MPNLEDYFVTWCEVKSLVGEELTRRGKNENDKIPFGVIECILKNIWQERKREIEKKEVIGCPGYHMR